MRVVVKQLGNLINELTFDEGPIYLGRQAGTQVHLPHLSVSRQHAVIYSTQDGKWFAEDLGSSNKTYLNDGAIRKAEIKDGDLLRIANYTVEIHLKDEFGTGRPIDMADTLKAVVHGPQTVIRKVDAKDAPDIKMPPRRGRDFIQAVANISTRRNTDELLSALLDLVMKQFGAFHLWIGLRKETTGPMTSYSGKKRSGESLKLNDLMLQEAVNNSLEKSEYVLIPHVPRQKGYERIRSAVMAPILGTKGCYGVIYTDNAMDHEHYSLTDLDYLMLLSIHAGVLIESF
jgi:hypothetical protein